MLYHFYVGSYNKADEDRIFYCSLNSQNGRMAIENTFQGLTNPSYLLMSRDKKYLFAVEELTPKGNVAILKENAGHPELLMKTSTEGADPCQLTLNENGSVLYAANYTSGSLASFHVDEENESLTMLQFIQEEGTGPNKERQECAHIHFSGWFGKDLYVNDLGSDLVRCFHSDGEKLTEDPSLSIHVDPGYGPRHFAVNPDYPDLLYLVTEMGSRICVYDAIRADKPRWNLAQELTTQSPGYKGEGAAAAILFDGDHKFLFTSDRSSNSIASYRVGVGGLLSRAGDTSCGGIMPRDFAIFGDLIVVANQESSTLTVVRIESDGKLTLLPSALTISHPSCVLPA